MATASSDDQRFGEAALQRLKSTEPPLYLSPSPELSKDARTASAYLYSALVPFAPTAPPFDRLLVDEQFDAEQIWEQINALSKPLLSFVRRELGRLEREPLEPSQAPKRDTASKKVRVSGGEDEDEDEEMDIEDEDEERIDDGEEEEDEVEEEDEEDDDDEEKEEEEEENEEGAVEDQFFKIKDLEQYLNKGDEEEYGVNEGKRKKEKKAVAEDEDEDEDEDDDEEELELDDFDEDEEEDGLAERARYDDFYGGKKKSQQKSSNKRKGGSSDPVDFIDGSEDIEEDDNQHYNEGGRALSTHEKERQKLQTEIEQLEKANLEPKAWTMQGEITAAKRPKNSALEVDLDFDHNARPAPVITEEVTASLEDLIRRRIIEGQFDDVQRAPPIVAKAPKDLKELDENKSKKGLAEIYEEEYAQKTGLAPALLSATDELKKEASMLFKRLALKLDALSHFHFAPKPVIEDMSIQSNVPALAMEEIAPVAVSDAAMLAPEEVFKGTGDVKEETELTKEERRRRRANKKRKFKAVSKANKKEVKKMEPTQTDDE